jgi:hypothetical protein
MKMKRLILPILVGMPFIAGAAYPYYYSLGAGIVMAILGIIWFAMVAYIFSHIFWATYAKILNKGSARTRARK